VDPGANVEEKFSINHPIFKKREMRTQNNSQSLVHTNVRKKPKPTVKNSQRLGYISYDATTSSSVTFSYELIGPDNHLAGFFGRP
jgi:predicted O-linked N-acetylglucosamine transferase (SPINDLY family)